MGRVLRARPARSWQMIPRAAVRAPASGGRCEPGSWGRVEAAGQRGDAIQPSDLVGCSFLNRSFNSQAKENHELLPRARWGTGRRQSVQRLLLISLQPLPVRCWETPVPRQPAYHYLSPGAVPSRALECVGSQSCPMRAGPRLLFCFVFVYAVQSPAHGTYLINVCFVFI